MIYGKKLDRSTSPNHKCWGRTARPTDPPRGPTLTRRLQYTVYLLTLRSVGACVWPWLPERVVVVHIPCVLTTY